MKFHDIIKARKMILINKVLCIFLMWLLRHKYVVVAQGPQKYCHIKIMSENKKHDVSEAPQLVDNTVMTAGAVYEKVFFSCYHCDLRHVRGDPMAFKFRIITQNH